jgi:hypothetical protein
MIFFFCTRTVLFQILRVVVLTTAVEAIATDQRFSKFVDDQSP